MLSPLARTVIVIEEYGEGTSSLKSCELISLNCI
jgi:hypothetical protein